MQEYPGFLLLQEVQHTTCFDQLLEKLKTHYTFAPNFAYKGNPRGIATLAPFEALTTTAYHSVHREPLLQTPKILLLSHYSVTTAKHSNPQLLTILNLHGINFVSSQSFNAQMLQIKEAVSSIDHALIIAGDFNSWSRKRNRSIAQLIDQSPLHLTEVDFSTAQHPAKKAPLLLQLLFGSHHLDKILYSPKYLSLQKGSVEVLRHCGDLAIDSSDHLPLACSLSFI